MRKKLPLFLFLHFVLIAQLYSTELIYTPNSDVIEQGETPFSDTVSDAIFTDSRDGKKYKTVKIDSQTWMAENLNYNANDSKCYDNQTANCDKYGRLYDWNTAMNSCPKGWHLPTNAEWDILYKSNTAGKYLKDKSGWNNNGNGLDTYGFTALPGGYGTSGVSFRNVGNYGGWWSASENNAGFAYYRFMHYRNEDAYYGSGYKRNLFSVRCLLD